VINKAGRLFTYLPAHSIAIFLSYGFSLITVVLDSVLEVEELPRKRATKMIINTAPAATHTHGDVYQSVVVLVVVVVVFFSEALSFEVCAQMIIFIHVNKIIMMNL